MCEALKATDTVEEIEEDRVYLAAFQFEPAKTHVEWWRKQIQETHPEYWVKTRDRRLQVGMTVRRVYGGELNEMGGRKVVEIVPAAMSAEDQAKMDAGWKGEWVRGKWVRRGT